MRGSRPAILFCFDGGVPNLDAASPLERYGTVCATMAQTLPQGGRPSIEYYLNEAQALIICMKSDRAADVRPATLAGAQAILNYVDEGERNQGFPWEERVATADRELFEWHSTLHRSLAQALNRLTQ
jgi:hypothetical protein